MLIKITSENPQFEQDIALLKLKYRTGAASKAARLAIQDFSSMEIEREVFKFHYLSMAY